MAELETPANLSEAGLDRLIDAHRRGDFAVALRDVEGRPAGGAVTYELVRHDFEFGTAIASRMVGAPDPVSARNRGLPSADEIARYDQIVTTYFNSVVVENAMKWPLMEDADGPDAGKEARALFMADWARERDLYLRGHTLIWGVARWQPDWLKALAEQPAEVVEARVKARLDRALTLFAPYVREWDLNNEMMHEDIFGRAMNLPNGAAYFTWAKAIDPDVTYYVNEYGVLQGNEVDRYVAHIRQLLDAGAKVGGIGDQAHFFKPVPENRRLWAILDKLGQFGLPVKITEFDLHYNGMTDAEQAEQLRRFYRVCFAHPAVEGIYMWGFYENAHWRQRAALWRPDWTPKPAAEAYMALMTDTFHTAGDAEADASGGLRFRGFHGTYRFTSGGRSGTLRLNAGSPTGVVTLE